MPTSCAWRLIGSHVRGRSSPWAQHSRLAERAFQKIILQPKLLDLGVQRLQVHARLGRRRRTAEHLGGSTQQLAASLADLMRVNIVLVRDLGNRLAVAYSVRRHLGLERPPSGCGAVVCS